MEKIFYDNGTLNDITAQVSDYYADALPFPYEAGQFLYFGSFYPFNSFYLKTGIVNVTPCKIKIEYWSNEWIEAVETIDGSKNLTQSGLIKFVPSKNHNWMRESTKENGTAKIPELGDLEIYDLFWVRVSFDSTLSGGPGAEVGDPDLIPSIKWIGNKFCADEDLYVEHREFKATNFKNSYESGKTDWEEEIVRATELVIEALIEKAIIDDESQILDTKKLKNATVSRTALIVYDNLGDNYNDDAEKTQKKFYARLNKRIFAVDTDGDGRLDYRETGIRSGSFYR